MPRRRRPAEEGWRHRSARAAAAALLAVLGLGSVPHPAAARDAEALPADAPGNVLDRAVDDIVLLPVGADGADRLLVLHHGDDRADGARVELLVRRHGWERVAALEVGQPPRRATSPRRIPATRPRPWFVDLGEGRVAVVAPTAAGRTTVAVIDVRHERGDRLRLERTRVLDLRVTASGVADPTGDGRPALVLARTVTVPHGESCQGSRVVVLDARDLAVRQAFDIPGMRLAGATLGRWDRHPGTDLLAHAVRTCPAGVDARYRRVLLVVGLAAGKVVVQRVTAPDPAGDPPGIPLAFDLEGDGREEALVRLGDRLGLLEPSRAWGFTPIGEAGALALAAADRGSGSAVVAWIDPTAAAAPGIRFGAVGRDRGRVRITTVGALDGTAIDPGRWAGMVAEARGAALAGVSPATWEIDLDADDCPELVAALVLAECDGHGPVQPSAAWRGTSPVALVGPPWERRLLVAASLDWRVGRSTIGSPRPEAVDPGAWRIGPGPGPFALGELPVADLLDNRLHPRPRPAVATAAARDGTTFVSAAAGDRLFARVEDASDGAPRTRPPPGDLGALLGEPGTTGASRHVVRVPARTDGEAGRAAGRSPIALDPPGEPGASPPAVLRVTLAAVNDWGEPSEPIVVTVQRDLAGPAVAVDPPIVSLPWPFEARVHGRTEARAALRLPDGRTVIADRHGRFELRVRLAPWPQSLRLRAVDRYGNGTSVEVPVMGGVDVPRLPWQWLLAGGLVVAVATNAVRTGRTGAGASSGPASARSPAAPPATAPGRSSSGRPRAGRLPAATPGDQGLEVEDVPAGSGVPRG